MIHMIATIRLDHSPSTVRLLVCNCQHLGLSGVYWAEFFRNSDRVHGLLKFRQSFLSVRIVQPLSSLSPTRTLSLT